jgi:hypothetical protein
MLLMPKALSIMGMLVAILLILVSALDLALGLPFGGAKASAAMDIGMIVGGGMLAYLGWSAYREQT